MKLVRELRPDFEPYFAEQQNSLDGLSNSILSALHACSAFICVMHPRGVVQPLSGDPWTRGSIWIEQEIAIATFIVHTLGRQLLVLPYVHSTVRIEGIRTLLHLNPVVFDEEVQVLNHLRSALPALKISPNPKPDSVLTDPKVAAIAKWKGKPITFEWVQNTRLGQNRSYIPGAVLESYDELTATISTAGGPVTHPLSKLEVSFDDKAGQLKLEYHY